MQVFERFDDSRGWSEDERILLDQVTRLADEVIAPNARALRPRGVLSLGKCRVDPGTRAQRDLRARRLRGAPMSYRVYLECMKLISEACAATGDCLRHQLPRHGAGARFRIGGAQGAHHAARRGGRDLLARDHRTERRVGRDRDDDAVLSRRRRGRHRRRQDLHHLGRRRRPDPASSANGRISTTTAARSPLWCWKGDARVHRRTDRGQDGHPRVFDRGARVRRLPGAPREPGGRAGGGAFHSSSVAQQVAAQHREPRPRNRRCRVQGHGRLHERPPPVGAAHRRFPGQPVHAPPTSPRSLRW